MRQRIFAAGAALLATAVLALPSWGAHRSGEAQESEPGDPKVFAVGEFKGWVSRLQAPGVRGLQAQAAWGGAAGSSTWRPQGRRRDRVAEDRRWSGLRHRRDPESYMILKGGGLHVTQDPRTTGGYVGIEMGGSVDEVLQVGFSLDYFHHRNDEMVVLQEGETNGLPVRVEQTISESVAHLVPVGLTMRVRIPLAGQRITPFLSGTLAYEMLFLENQGSLPSQDPVLSQLEERETFTGFGWQAAGGVDVSLSPTFGLIGELGWHRSSPRQEVLLNGQEVDLKVDLDGPFLRGGLRIFM
jgi:hypothetical protein